jgi:Domain of unknown function (DUF4345)
MINFDPKIFFYTVLPVKSLHLAISSALIIAVGLGYGLMPAELLSSLLNIEVEETSLKNIFRASMGLYIGMACFWIYGIRKENYWAAATLSNVILMMGLALGRTLSQILDGQPSVLLLIGLLVEVALAIWGILSLKKYQKVSG